MMQIGNLLSDAIGKYRSGGDGDMLRVWDIWADTMGNDIAANTRPSAFKGKRLTVNVSNSAWLQHLTFMKNDLIKKINLAMQKELVTDLTFKIGSINPPDKENGAI